MAKYVDLLGILFLVYGAFNLLLAFVFGLLYVMMGGALGGIGASQGEAEAMVVGGILAASGGIVGCAIALYAVPTMIAGVGIRRRAPWGRVLGLGMGALALTSFPFGTALGVFALVALLDKEAAATFVKGAHA